MGLIKVNFCSTLICITACLLAGIGLIDQARADPPRLPPGDPPKIYADEHDGGRTMSIPSTIPDSIKRNVASNYKLSVNSPLLRELFRRMENGEDVYKPTHADRKEPLPVIKHYRGKEGKALPTSADVKAFIEMKGKEGQEAMIEFSNDPKISTEIESIKQAIAKPTPKVLAPNLPSCSNDETHILRVQDGKEVSSVKDVEILTDMLYTRGPIPMSPETAFGEKTLVIRYSAGEDSLLSLAAARDGLPCLPYRVRLTPEYIIQDSGLNALKNYDHNPKGELYEWVSQRLSEYR